MKSSFQNLHAARLQFFKGSSLNHSALRKNVLSCFHVEAFPVLSKRKNSQCFRVVTS